MDLAGAGLVRPAAPGPRTRRRPTAAVGTAPTPAATVTPPGAARVSAASGQAGLPGGRAETLRMLPGPAQGPDLRARRALPSDQEAHQDAGQDREGRLTGHSQHYPATALVSGQPGTPAGLNHKLRMALRASGLSLSAVSSCRMWPCHVSGRSRSGSGSNGSGSLAGTGLSVTFKEPVAQDAKSPCCLTRT